MQEKSEIIPSRSVSMKNYQYLDIVYPGNGWIYLGESVNSKNFIFYGRKLGGKDTSFTLRSKNPGRFILHFYKNDALTGNFIDDYLEVIVDDEKSSSNEHILCPMYKEIVPPKYEKNQVKEENQFKSMIHQLKYGLPSSREHGNKLFNFNGNTFFRTGVLIISCTRSQVNCYRPLPKQYLSCLVPIQSPIS